MLQKSIQDLKIVFFGTPDFAVAALAALLDAGCNVVGVVTVSDKETGRGQQLSESAVKQYATEKNLHIFQPPKLKDPAFLEELKNLKADLGVVVAFRMMPTAVWSMPPMGTVNIHGSLLPKYRGAAPIQWAILNGDKTTGVTTFKLKHEIDTGNILLQKEVPILEDDTYGTLYTKLMEAGASLLIETVEKLANGEAIEQEQVELSQNSVSHAPKIFKEDGRLDFGQPAEQLHNKVRGLNPMPSAFTYVHNKMLKIHRSHFELFGNVPAPATLSSDNKTYLRFATIDGWLYADEVQLAGKKAMPIADFLRGFKP